jgi:hypothetical protein
MRDSRCRMLFRPSTKQISVATRLSWFVSQMVPHALALLCLERVRVSCSRKLDSGLWQTWPTGPCSDKKGNTIVYGDWPMYKPAGSWRHSGEGPGFYICLSTLPIRRAIATQGSEGLQKIMNPPRTSLFFPRLCTNRR